ncbi:MAG: autotransporter-associated beta strand repeat-containing protein [Kiritimatiellia bacterium]
MKSATILTVVLAAMAASAENKTWVGGAEGEWAEAANWEPSGAPGEGDVLVFDSTEPITVLLAETQSMAGLATTETTPLVTFKGLDTGSTIKARQDIKSGWKGPVTFDEHAHVQFIAGKVWWPEAEVKLLGGVSATKGNTPTLGFIGGSAGRYVVRGPVDFPNSVNFAAPIDWDPSSVTEGTYYNVGSCDLQYNSAPAVEGHLIRFAGGTGGLGGTAPLMMESPDPTRPDTLINQYANPNLYLCRTMPTVIPNWFAICGAAACNNNRTGFTFGSGAELRISGDVTTGTPKDYVSENPSGGLKLVFQGAGTNVRLTGDNTYQGASGSSTEILHSNGVGYNSVEIDGKGSEIHPFGTGNVNSNNGHGLFIKPLSAGKTLVNGFSYGNSVNNNNAYTFAFDGANDLTVSGSWTLGTAYSMIPVLGDMTLTLTGTLDPKAKNFDFAGTGNVVLGPTSQYTGSTGTLNKHSSGNLTLQGTLAGTSYNKAYFSGGKTTLDYTVNEGSRLNTAKSETALADALRLRGTELVLKGGAVAETVGEGNGTTYNNGLTKVRREGGSSTIYLGTLTRPGTNVQTYTGTLDFEDGVVKVDSSLANTMLSGNITVDGDHFASVAEDGTVVKADDSVATKVTEGKTIARQVVDYVIFEPSADGQVFEVNNSSDGAIVANKGGMIFRGPYDFTVTGEKAWLAGANIYNDALVFTHAGTGVFTFTGKLDRYGFTKRGPGTFRFTGTSNLSQSLNLYEGVFEVASANGFSPASKSSYQVYLNGGTLKTSVDVELVRPMSIGDNGGTIEVAVGTTFTQTSNAANTADNTAGPVVKTGAGTWLVSGEYQAAGKVRIEEGTVKLGSDKGLGDASARTRAIAPTELVGGTIDVAGFNAKLGNFYLKGGTVEDSSEEKTGSLAAYTHYVEAGTVNAPLANGVHQNGSCYFNATNLKKTGPGTVTLNAANTFQGTAYVEDGTLDLTGSLASGACVEGGVLTGKGSIDGYVYVTADGTLAPKAGAMMELGDHLAIGEGGTLRLAANASGVSKVMLMKGNAYLGKDARLEFDLSQGGIARFDGSVLVDLPEGARVEGSFANFVNGKYTDAAGNKYTISYTAGDGNDIAVVGRGRGFSLVVR